MPISVCLTSFGLILTFLGFGVLLFGRQKEDKGFFVPPNVLYLLFGQDMARKYRATPLRWARVIVGIGSPFLVGPIVFELITRWFF